MLVKHVYSLFLHSSSLSSSKFGLVFCLHPGKATASWKRFYWPCGWCHCLQASCWENRSHSCDKSRASQKFVQYACKAEVMQKNILERDLEACGPCDTFIWTAPCVTFSSLGNQKGMDNLTGTLAAFSLAYIRRWRPRTILSEMLRLCPCTSNTEPSANWFSARLRRLDT